MVPYHIVFTYFFRFSVRELQQSLFETWKPEDTFAISHRRKALHLRVPGLRQGLQQCLRPCQTPEQDTLQRGKSIKRIQFIAFEIISLEHQFPMIYFSCCWLELIENLEVVVVGKSKSVFVTWSRAQWWKRFGSLGLGLDFAQAKIESNKIWSSLHTIWPDNDHNHVFFTETLCVQGARLYKTLHGPLVAEETCQNCAWSRVLR